MYKRSFLNLLVTHNFTDEIGELTQLTLYIHPDGFKYRSPTYRTYIISSNNG